MKIPFTKLHGAKNDFLMTPAADVPITDLQELAIAICDRYTGVGADGWMLLDRTDGTRIMTLPSGCSTPMAASRKFPATARGAPRCCLPATDKTQEWRFRIRTGAGIKAAAAHFREPKPRVPVRNEHGRHPRIWNSTRRCRAATP